MYLAVVLDLATRMVVGWALDTSMTTRLVTRTLAMAQRQGYVGRKRYFPC